MTASRIYVIDFKFVIYL